MTPPKPTPKKEKAETTQTIIMNWSLERSVHILHLHFFFPFPARCTKLYWCASGLSFIGIFVRGQSTKKSCGGKSQTRSDKALAVKHLFIWILVLGFLYSGKKKEEMKSRLTRCQWSLSGLLKLWLMEYQVGCVIIQKSFAEKLFLKTDQGKHQWKVGILRLEVAWDRKIMLRWIKLPLGFQYVAVSLLFGGIFVLHVHEVIWIFVSWFPIFERCPWSCHMFQPIVAFERSFAKSLAIVLTNLQLVIINLMAT